MQLIACRAPHKINQSLKKDQNFSLRDKSFVHTEYLSLLIVQGQFGVICCLSNFDDLVSTFDLKF